jgi:hypothetical protein
LYLDGHFTELFRFLARVLKTSIASNSPSQFWEFGGFPARHRRRLRSLRQQACDNLEQGNYQSSREHGDT